MFSKHNMQVNFGQKFAFKPSKVQLIGVFNAGKK